MVLAAVAAAAYELVQKHKTTTVYQGDLINFLVWKLFDFDISFTRI